MRFLMICQLKGVNAAGWIYLWFQRHVIVSSNLLVLYSKIALRGYDARVSRQIQDGDDVCIGSKHLCCHYAAQLMAARSRCRVDSASHFVNPQLLPRM